MLVLLLVLAQDVVVTGTYAPIPLEEADRNVHVLRIEPLLKNTIADILKLDPSVDLRQRAGNGLQTDISIRGASFGQTLILLNGLRLNDAQSGHHNFDLPLPLEAFTRVEVLKGSGSTLYGSDAVGGVVNFITGKPETTELRLRGGIGNFGVHQERGIFNYRRNLLTQQFSASRDFSTGFQPGRDYRNLSLASITHYGSTGVILAHNDRPFGADQFYGNANSWERTKTWFAGVQQSFGEKTQAAFAFRRHTDLFVLHRYREQPDAFTNRHAVESFQVNIRRAEDLGRNTRLHYGAEGYRDAIDSNNLGRHHRGRGAGYVALDMRALQRFSLSLGLRDEVWGSGNHELSPSLAGGMWLSPKWKLRASASRAFRLPTYTELYYRDPFTQGTSTLRPERAWTYEAGLDWNPGNAIRAELTYFERHEQNGIDFVRPSPTAVWVAANLAQLRFKGVEAITRLRLPHKNELTLSYTGLNGARDALAGMISRYVFNYAQHQGIANWQVTLPRVALRTRVGALQRIDRATYAVWDIYATASEGRVRPFIQFTNLTNTRYQEIPGVNMQGRAVVGGLEWIVYR
jgi:iron complex outermembrane receptor protein